MKLTKLCLTLTTSLFLALPVFAQSGNVVVNIPGGVTCSTTKGEPGFEVGSWKIGGSTGDAISSGTLRTTAPQLQNLVLNRILDACSEQLIKHFIAATQIPVLTLTQYDTIGGSGRVYPAIMVTLSNSVIDSYMLSGAASVRSSETIDILYSKVCIATVSQNSDGTLQQPQHVCYDAITHKVS